MKQAVQDAKVMTQLHPTRVIVLGLSSLFTAFTGQKKKKKGSKKASPRNQTVVLLSESNPPDS